MLIDEFLPQYHVAKSYQIDIHAPLEEVYAAVRDLDVSESTIIRGLFRLRGLPAESLKLEGLLQAGFTILAENQPREFLMGLAGRFWTPSGELQPINPGNFKIFNKSGFAKAVWNFSLHQTGENNTRLSTETRVFCLDKKSRRIFRAYWFFVGPFSGLIRSEALKAVKRKTEKKLEDVFDG